MLLIQRKVARGKGRGIMAVTHGKERGGKYHAAGITAPCQGLEERTRAEEVLLQEVKPRN